MLNNKRALALFLALAAISCGQVILTAQGQPTTGPMTAEMYFPVLGFSVEAQKATTTDVAVSALYYGNYMFYNQRIFLPGEIGLDAGQGMQLPDFSELRTLDGYTQTYPGSVTYHFKVDVPAGKTAMSVKAKVPLNYYGTLPLFIIWPTTGQVTRTQFLASLPDTGGMIRPAYSMPAVSVSILQGFVPATPVAQNAVSPMWLNTVKLGNVGSYVPKLNVLVVRPIEPQKYLGFWLADEKGKQISPYVPISADGTATVPLAFPVVIGVDVSIRVYGVVLGPPPVNRIGQFKLDDIRMSGPCGSGGLTVCSFLPTAGDGVVEWQLPNK